MKVSVLLIGIVSLLIFGSCSNDDDVNPRDSLVGKWRWIRSLGGITGSLEYTPESTGHELMYIFENDLSYIKTDNGDTIQSSTYILSRDTTIFSGEVDNAIKLNEKFLVTDSQGQDSIMIIEMDYIYRFHGDTLILIHNVPDSYKSWYVIND